MFVAKTNGASYTIILITRDPRMCNTLSICNLDIPCTGDLMLVPERKVRDIARESISHYKTKYSVINDGF